MTQVEPSPALPPPVGDDVMLVLEQTLGHVVHGQNLVQVIEGMPEVASRVLPIPFSTGGAFGRIPLAGSWTVRASLQARRKVLRELRHRPPDVLFVHTFSAALLLRDVARKVPVVLSTDATPRNFDSLASSYGHAVGAAASEALKLRIMREVVGQAAAVVTWSHWAAESVVDDYGLPAGRVKVIRPGVRLDRFRVGRHAAPGAKLRLLFVGGDFSRKGGDDLLRAMWNLNGDAELDVVTSQPPGAVPPGVRVHVGLSHDSPELFSLYERADAFVLPTRGDAYGLVFAEAMACGLPVVTCAVGAVPELVQHGETGLLVEPARPDQLTSALRTLIDRPDLRRRMGDRGREHARANHDASRTCAELVDLLRQVARRDSLEHMSSRTDGA